MNLNKFSLAYSRDGLIGFLNILLSKFGFKSRIKNGVEKRLIWLNKFLSKNLNNKVYQGIYKDMHISKNIWSENDLSSKLLGIYEEEVQKEILALQKDSLTKKDILINLGSADGYHAIGLLKSKLFESVIVFDKDKESFESFKENLEANNLKSNISYHGEADENFIENLSNLEFDNCFFLIDIEGDEFKILNHNNLNKIKKSNIILEFHEKFDERDEKFINMLKSIFKIKIFINESKNVNKFEILQKLNDVDRVLTTNENRICVMKWIVCTPK